MPKIFFDKFSRFYFPEDKMEIILKITPNKVFVDGKFQKEKTLYVKPDSLLEYGFSKKEISRISDEWDTNKISRRDSKYTYTASPKY